MLPKGLYVNIEPSLCFLWWVPNVASSPWLRVGSRTVRCLIGLIDGVFWFCSQCYHIGFRVDIYTSYMICTLYMCKIKLPVLGYLSWGLSIENLARYICWSNWLDCVWASINRSLNPVPHRYLMLRAMTSGTFSSESEGSDPQGTDCLEWSALWSYTTEYNTCVSVNK